MLRRLVGPECVPLDEERLTRSSRLVLPGARQEEIEVEVGKIVCMGVLECALWN